MRTGRIIAMLAVALLGAGLFGATALAGKKKKTAPVFFSGYPKLTGNKKTVQARGALNTTTACRAGRGMVLFLANASGVVLATLDGSTSDANGNWKLQGNVPTLPPGTGAVSVQVKAKKRAVGKFVCKAGFSQLAPIAVSAVARMGEEHASSRVTIRSKGHNTFKGRVSSDNASCVSHRTVKLLQKTPNGPKSISQGIADENGVWRVGLEGTLSGDFFAKVTAKRIGSLTCDKARSSSVHV